MGFSFRIFGEVELSKVKQDLNSVSVLLGTKTLTECSLDWIADAAAYAVVNSLPESKHLLTVLTEGKDFQVGHLSTDRRGDDGATQSYYYSSEMDQIYIVVWQREPRCILYDMSEMREAREAYASQIRQIAKEQDIPLSVCHLVGLQKDIDYAQLKRLIAQPSRVQYYRKELACGIYRRKKALRALLGSTFEIPVGQQASSKLAAYIVSLWQDEAAKVETSLDLSTLQKLRSMHSELQKKGL